MAVYEMRPAERLSIAILEACGMDPATVKAFTLSSRPGGQCVMTVTLADDKDIDVDGHPLPPVRWVPER